MTYAPHSYVKLLAGDEAGEYGVVHAHTGTMVMVERISGKQAKSISGKQAKSDRRNGPVGYHVDEIECHPPIYPFIDQLQAVKTESQIIGGYLDWLTNEKHLTICEWDGRDYTPHLRVDREAAGRVFRDRSGWRRGGSQPLSGRLSPRRRDGAGMKITYEQAFADHKYLWTTYGAADDMTGGYVDSHDLDRLLLSPTKATARDCLEDQIIYWFEVGPDSLCQLPIDPDDPRLIEIAERYDYDIPR